MKIAKKLSLMIILFCFLMVGTAWASEPTWEDAQGHHEASILLDENVTSSKDSVYRYGRGEYLAEGSVEIVNRGEGVIYVRADTFAYVCVDRILHHIFLEYWDEDENDWIQVGYWEFEKTKEETEDGELYMLTSAFALTGYPTDLYYRVRGLHGVEYHGELEACATRTNGVLITDR